MKYIKSKKFSEITAMDNYSGLGIEAFQELERGETVEIQKPDLALNRGFIKKQKSGDK